MPDLLDYIEYRQRTVLRESDKGGPGDYLVVEDPELSSKWHLRVRRGGSPDHNLMAAARAALTSNHRGNPYQGPNKGGALAELKAMYKSEGMEWGKEE